MSMGPVFSFRTPCLSLVKVSRDYTPVCVSTVIWVSLDMQPILVLINRYWDKAISHVLPKMEQQLEFLNNC